MTGMPDGMILAAGGINLAGAFKKAGGFPSEGYAIVAATIALAFLVSLSADTVIGKPVKAFAGLTLLVSIIRNVPAFTGKVKDNG